jgi:hypothetical protein
MWTRDELPYEVEDSRGRQKPLRDMAAEVLRAASRLLDGLATRLSWAPQAPAAEPVLEFYADAGAPEGALYVDGVLVGHLSGVSRL